MEIRVGPLPSAWVRAWALDASAAMRQASARAVPMPFSVGDEFFERNRALARHWFDLASDDDIFVWEGEVDPDELLAMMQYWRNLAQVRHDLMERGVVPAMHVDAERFGQLFRRTALDVLVASGRMTADHADRMESTWPKLSRPGDGHVAQHERDTRGAAR